MSDVGAGVLARALLLQRLRLKRNILLPGGFFFGVSLHPRFPALAGGGVAAGEREGGDIGIRNRDFLRRILGIEPYEGVSQRRPAAPVEQIALNRRAVFASDGDVASIIERFLESTANFLLAGELGDPAFEFLVSPTRYDFERIWIERIRLLR